MKRESQTQMNRMTIHLRREITVMPQTSMRLKSPSTCEENKRGRNKAYKKNHSIVIRMMIDSMSDLLVGGHDTEVTVYSQGAWQSGHSDAFMYTTIISQ